MHAALPALDAPGPAAEEGPRGEGGQGGLRAGGRPLPAAGRQELPVHKDVPPGVEGRLQVLCLHRLPPGLAVPARLGVPEPALLRREPDAAHLPAEGGGGVGEARRGLLLHAV